MHTATEGGGTTDTCDITTVGGVVDTTVDTVTEDAGCWSTDVSDTPDLAASETTFITCRHFTVLLTEVKNWAKIFEISLGKILGSSHS